MRKAKLGKNPKARQNCPGMNGPDGEPSKPAREQDGGQGVQEILAASSAGKGTSLCEHGNDPSGISDPLLPPAPSRAQTPQHSSLSCRNCLCNKNRVIA